MVDLYWAEGAFPGRVAVAGRPRGGLWLGDEMAAFAAAGVTTLVSALGERETRECQLDRAAEAAEAAGITFRWLPIPNLLTPEHDAMLHPIGELADIVRGGGSVAAHCFASIGRSPLIIASTLVLLGLDADDAWTRVERARGREVPDTLVQRRWVHDLEAYVRAARRS